MPGIFISYRREDSGGYAGRLYDLLCERFGRQRIFMDLDGIAGGENFATVIEERIGASDVVLAVIGERWLTVTGADGVRRLDASEDWVRLEIGEALERGERVIPVLVDNGRMPTAEELPEVLRPLAARQAMELRNAHFRDDAQRLIGVLGQVVPRWGDRRQRTMQFVAAFLVVVAAVLGGAIVVWQRDAAVGRPGGAGVGVARPASSDLPAKPSVSNSVGPVTTGGVIKPTPTRPAWRGGSYESIVTYDWQNAVYDETFDLQVDGDEVSGVASFVGLKCGIESGTISGDRIRFVTKTATRTPSGKTIQDVHTYKGTVRGDVIQFSMLTVSESDSHVPVLFTAKPVKKKNVLRGRRSLRDLYTASRGAAEIQGLRAIGASRE